jgi:hypothetical protein
MYRDRTRQTSTSIGTGAFVLSGSAPLGTQSFATAFGASPITVAYCIEAVNPDGTLSGAWETGTGTFDGSTGLTRTTVLASSNAGLLVNFGVGTKNVFCTAPAAYLLPFTSTTQGVVPASGGGTTNFLRADGTFAAPPGGGGGSPGAPTTSVQYNNAGAFAGNANFTYDSGTNTVTFGNATGSALGMTIQPRVPTVLEDAGTLLISAQDAVKPNSNGGVVALVGGNSTGTGFAGHVNLNGGVGLAGGYGGNIALTAGDGSLFGGGFTAASGSTGSESGAIFVMDGGNPGVAGGSFAMGAGFSSAAAGGSFTMFLGGGTTDDGYMEWQDALATPFMRFQTATPSGAKQMGFFGATPVVRQAATNTSSVHAALKNYGLLTAASTYASDVAGANTQIQYNNSGAFGANANFTYTVGTNTLTTGNITGSALGMTVQPKTPTVLEDAGTLTLAGQNAVKANSNGGPVNINAGTGIGFGFGGNVEVQAGNALIGSGNAGDFKVFAGDANTGDGGSIELYAGDSNNSGGQVILSSGSTPGAYGAFFVLGEAVAGVEGGYVSISGGSTFDPGMTGGNVGISAGAGDLADGEIAFSHSSGAYLTFKTATPAGAPQAGFFGATPVAQPVVTGSRSANAALASFLSGLASLGLITDSTTAGTAPSGSVAQVAATIGPVPYNVQYAEFTVVDANITALSKINISWGNITDADENTPDMSNVYFQPVPAAGSMIVRLSCVDPLDRLGGVYKINYLIG